MANTTTDPELNHHIDFDMIIKNYDGFYSRFINPKNMWVMIPNSQNHEITKSLVEEVIESSGFSIIESNQPAISPREPPLSKFKGGIEIVVKTEDDSDPSSNDLYLVWEAVQWDHPDCHVFYVLEWLFGSASDFMEGGPGRGMHCRAVSIHRQQEIVEINTIFKLFKRNGIFGMHYKVNPDSTAEGITDMLYNMVTLADTITEEELMRAKNSQSLKVAMNMERQLERSTELAYNVYVRFAKSAFRRSKSPKLHRKPAEGHYGRCQASAWHDDLQAICSEARDLQPR